jgi:Fic family protein
MKNGNADISYYSANHIEEQLVELIKKAREHRSNLRIVVAAAMFGHFLSIHPFQDGNGRAARFLLQACLRKQGLWNDLDLPLGHLAKLDRKNYIQSLRGLTINGNYQKFMEYTSMWIAAAAELAFLKKSSERQ